MVTIRSQPGFELSGIDKMNYLFEIVGSGAGK
jgi:hypothetical protein